MDQNEIKRLGRKAERAREGGHVKEAVNSFMELASYLASYEKYEEALVNYEEALSISEAEDLINEVSTAQRMIAETYCSLGEYKEAIKYADLYLKSSRMRNDKIEEQRGYATKGRIYFCWAEYLSSGKSRNRKRVDSLLNESLCAYRKSLKLCECEIAEIDMNERSEMKARLFLNLGLALGSLGSFKEAFEHFSLAIRINKKLNNKENLFLCYLNLGEYYVRSGDCINACAYFDLAAQSSDLVDQTCCALSLKSNALIKMGKNADAKNTLRKAYKLKKGKDPEVVRDLRIVIYLDKLEKLICSTAESDYIEKKKLYEKKGDAYCALKQYKFGVQAYLKMLEFAEKAGCSNKELLPCYSSLALTYKDNEEYHNALIYCQKELELLNENSIEASKTYTFLGELFEYLQYDYATIVGTYKKAQEIARKNGNKGQEYLVVKNIIQMQKDFGYDLQAEEYEKSLTELQRESGSFSDDESELDENTENFSCDVDDDELLSDLEVDKPRHQTRRNMYKIKRNQKGETELHVAVIKGNYNKVKNLIELGHPVNEKDLAGWTVLHEACNHGHTEIVKLLLDSGANINDPGGTECGGITPLHDAAENGHFDVIYLLLERGACRGVITNEGRTPLNCLKRWRSTVTLDDTELRIYDDLCKLLKTGFDTTESKENIRRTNTKLKKMASNVELDPEESFPSTSKSCNLSGAKMYQNAIKGLRRRHNPKIPLQKPKKGISPLVIVEDLSGYFKDDWLEEDMQITQRTKRRRVEPESQVCKGSTVVRSIASDCSTDEELDIELKNIENISTSENPTLHGCGNVSPVFNVKPVKNQKQMRQDNTESTTIVNNRTEVVLDVGDLSDITIGQTRDHQTAGNPPSVTVEEHEEPKANDFLYCRFNVQVDNVKLYVPVSKKKLSELTVEWLANEVSERYRYICSTTPILRIKTADGAIAFNNDPLSIFADGSTIETEVLQWRPMTLSERYESAIKSNQINSQFQYSLYDLRTSFRIKTALDNLSKSGNLILNYMQLLSPYVTLVFIVLKEARCHAKTINLSSNFLRDFVIQDLINYLSECSVERLYLRSNGITVQGIKTFAEGLKEIKEETLNKIKLLDFSYNRLTNDSVDYLNDIIDVLPNLQYLRLETCEITQPLKELRSHVSESVL